VWIYEDRLDLINLTDKDGTLCYPSFLFLGGLWIQRDVSDKGIKKYI